MFGRARSGANTIHPLLLNARMRKLVRNGNSQLKSITLTQKLQQLPSSMKVGAAVTANGTAAVRKVNRIRKMVNYIQIL